VKGVLVDTILWPLAQLYRVGITGRNLAYDLGLARQYQPKIPVVSVGNLSAGGTGKTPHVEYLIRHLAADYKIAVVSRGYKRRTNGFLYLHPDSRASDVGDEPLQIYQKFAPQIISAVCERRAVAIKRILDDHPEIDLVLLDDAFQHRSVRPHLNIVLTDFSQPFWHDSLLPAGRLREPRSRINRADMLIITKCPLDLPESEKLRLTAQARQYLSRKATVYFTGVRHGAPTPGVASVPKELPGNNVTLVTGIANTGLIAEYIASQYNLISHLRLRDHYRYSAMDLGTLLSTTQKPEGHFFLTTEKDLVKWRERGLVEKLEGKPVYYLPFEIVFLDREEAYIKQVQTRLDSVLRRDEASQ